MFNQRLFDQRKCGELLGKDCIPLIDIQSTKSPTYILPAGRRCIVTGVTIDGDGDYRVSVRELCSEGNMTPFCHSLSLDSFGNSFIRA